MTDEESGIDPEPGAGIEVTVAATPSRRAAGRRFATYGVPAVLVVMLGAAAGFLAWKDAAQRDVDLARTESVAAARDATTAILSYRAETVEQDLMAARDRITGEFLDSYTDLVNNTVIPGAREKKISAQAKVPAAASMSVDGARAVVLVFVDQTVTTGGSAPAASTSSVRVTLDRIGGRWLVSAFEPV